MAEERPNYAEQLLAAKNVPSDKWYYLWHFQTTLWEESKTPSLVCKSCETKWPADEMGEYTKGVFKPFITHCPLVKKCRAAAVYWATTADEPMAALKLFREQHTPVRYIVDSGVKPKPIVVTGFQALPANLVDQDDIDSHFDDADYIDMQKPVLRRSK